MTVEEDKSRLEEVADKEFFKRLVESPNSEYVRINIGFPLRYHNYVTHKGKRYSYMSRRKLKFYFEVTSFLVKEFGSIDKINILNNPIKDGTYQYNHEFRNLWGTNLAVQTENRINIRFR